MNTKNFKNFNGVCDDTRVLREIDDYLKENANDLVFDLFHSVQLPVYGKMMVAEFTSGCYAHDNDFEVQIFNDEGMVIGYCETLHSNYL